jgi:CBS domain-containing protein
MVVPSNLAVDRLVEKHVLGEGQHCFFVADNGSMEGVITLHNLRNVPREQRGALMASQVMTRIDGVLRASPEDDVGTVLQNMDESDVNQVPVMDNGPFLGLITRKSLLHDIRLRAELGV